MANQIVEYPGYTPSDRSELEGRLIIITCFKSRQEVKKRAEEEEEEEKRVITTKRKREEERETKLLPAADFGSAC
jgi:hypothetical protein